VPINPSWKVWNLTQDNQKRASENKNKQGKTKLSPVNQKRPNVLGVMKSKRRKRKVMEAWGNLKQESDLTD